MVSLHSGALLDWGLERLLNRDRSILKQIKSAVFNPSLLLQSGYGSLQWPLYLKTLSTSFHSIETPTT